MDESATPPEIAPATDAEEIEYEVLPELHNLSEPVIAPPPEPLVIPSPVPSPARRWPVITLGLALIFAIATVALLAVHTRRLQTKIDQLTQTIQRQNTPPELAILSAAYGSGDHFADVTMHARSVISHPDNDFYAHPNWLGADPTPGWNKELVVIYEVKGQRHIFTTGEGGKVNTQILRDHALK